MFNITEPDIRKSWNMTLPSAFPCEQCLLGWQSSFRDILILNLFLSAVHIPWLKLFTISLHVKHFIEWLLPFKSHNFFFFRVSLTPDSHNRALFKFEQQKLQFFSLSTALSFTIVVALRQQACPAPKLERRLLSLLEILAQGFILSGIHHPWFSVGSLSFLARAISLIAYTRPVI